MSYEIEHNIPKDNKPAVAPRRPDLSTFFSTLREVDTSNPQVHSLPLPENVTAVYRLLAEAIQAMTGASGHGTDTQESLIEQLLQNARDPPREVVGVPQEFLDGLKRVSNKTLKKDEDCPICGQPFVEDPYPLVVRLPCHKDHKFDLECITPWLKINTTCPLDRKELLKKAPPPAVQPDEEDDFDNDMYA